MSQIQGKQVQPASATVPGVVTTGAQTFAGAKTFTANCLTSFSSTGSVSYTLVNNNAGTAADAGYVLDNGTYTGGVILRGSAYAATPNRVSLHSSGGTLSSISFITNGVERIVLDTTSFTSTVPFVGSLTGNASTSTALQTGRTFSLTGDATGTSAAFTGAANASIPVTLANSGVTAATYGSNGNIPVITFNTKGIATSATSTPLTFLNNVGSSDANTDNGIGMRSLIWTTGSSNFPSVAGIGFEVRRASGSGSDAGTFQFATTNDATGNVYFRKVIGYSSGDTWSDWAQLLYNGTSYMQAVGRSNSWGNTNGTLTGAFNAIMGTSASATWLVSGTSAGTFRGGIQLLDAGGAMRLYTGPTTYTEYTGNNINMVSGSTLTTTTVNAVTVTSNNNTTGSNSLTILNSNGGSGADARLLLSNGANTGGLIIRSAAFSAPNRVTLYSSATTASNVSINTNGIDRVVVDNSTVTSTLPYVSSVGFQGNASDTVTTPSFSWSGDTTTGLYRPAASQVGVALGGSNIATFSAAGITLSNTASYADTLYNRIQSPGGGLSVGTVGSQPGAIRITLPVGWTNTLLRFTVKVFNYATGAGFDAVVAGYNYAPTSVWYNPTAYIVGQSDVNRNFTIRFGYTAGGKACVYIGELGSTWQFPQVYVTDVQLGYGGYNSNWATGWSVGFESTAFESVSQTVSTPQVGYATSTNTVNANVLRDGSGNFSAGTITAKFNGSSNMIAVSDGTTFPTAVSSVATSGSRSVDLAPNTYQRTVAAEFKNSSLYGFTGNYTGLVTIAPYVGTVASTGDANYQLAFHPSGAGSAISPSLKFRAGLDTTWGSWSEILHSGNVGNYAASQTTGTFTPTIAGTVVAGTGSYSLQRGRYTKTGNVVNFSLHIAWNSHSGTGNFYVLGLPFTSSNASAYDFWPVTISAIGLTWTAGWQLSARIPGNNTAIEIQQIDPATGTFLGVPMDTNVTSLIVSGFYNV
jgi:hypothetical protein